MTSRRVPQTPRHALPELGAPPDWLTALPTPRALAELGWQTALDAAPVDEKGRRSVNHAVAAVAVAVVVAWWVVTWRPWTPGLAAGVLWMTAVGYGLGVLWLCQAGREPWRWTTDRAAAATGSLLAFGPVCLLAGRPGLLAVTAVTAAQAFAHRSPEDDSSWRSEPKVRGAWLAAGLVKADPPCRFRRLGKPSADGASIRGVWVTGPRGREVALGITADSVTAAQRTRLEGVMRLEPGQLHLTHDGGEACAITITVTPPERTDVVVAEMPERWDYDQPLPIGRDRRGRPLSRPTWGRHLGVVGMTGSGKTWLARYDVAHAALDPTVELWLLDFKGDLVDWRALQPLCAVVVTGADVQTGRRALAALERLLTLSEARKDDPHAHGIVVVVDEWYRLVLACQRSDPKLAADLTSSFTELHATARSRRIKFVECYQAGTKDYISKALRINIGQRLCGITEKSDEVRYWMEQLPEDRRLPRAPGQFVYKDDGVRPVLVTAPALDRAGFERVCKRAATLRTAPAVEVPAEVVTDPLTLAVHELLDVEPMKPGVLLKQLPQDLRPASPQALGYLLRAMPGVQATKVGPKAEKGYKLTAECSASLRREAGKPLAEDSHGPEHAPQGHVPTQPSAAVTVP